MDKEDFVIMILPVSQQPKVLESINNGGEIDSDRLKRLIKTKN